MLAFHCLLGVLLLWGVSAETTVYGPLTIASFNIQNLGNSKFSKTDVMTVIKKIILRYDAIFVQEIVTKNEELIKNLVEDVNKEAPEGVNYDLVISERLGRTNAKEQYAYIYRTNRLSAKAQEVFPDNKGDFERPPFIVQFQSPTTRDFTNFLAIGIHTQPSKTVTEISEMATVYDYAKRKYKIEDAILMGDMNAGCSYVPIKNWTDIQLYTRTDFNWLISHDVDTTNSLSSCPYDRFVLSGKKINSGVISHSARAFDYMTDYGMNETAALAVSDHKVIEVKFRGKATPNAMKYIDTQLCLELQDLRAVDDLESLLSKVEKVKIVSVFEDENVWIATAASKKLNDLLNIVLQLVPDDVSTELADTLRYKVDSDILEDNTSFVAKNGKYLLTVTADVQNNLVSIKLCKETNPN